MRQVARLDVGVKLSTIASMQSQYDKLQVSLQKSQREEKLAAKTVSEAHAESAALRVSGWVLQSVDDYGCRGAAVGAPMVMYRCCCSPVVVTLLIVVCACSDEDVGGAGVPNGCRDGP
jgi:hypothetical protein